MARRHIYPTLPGEVAGRTGDMNAEINRRESQFARLPAGYVPSKRLVSSATVEPIEAGTSFSTVSTAGSVLAGNLNTKGLTLSVPAWLTVAAGGGGAGTNFSTNSTAGVSVTGTLNTSGLTLDIPAYLTTAMASNANTSFVGLNTAQTNVTWTVNSSGISLNAGGYAGTGYTSTTTTGTNFIGTQNTAGLNFAFPGSIINSFVLGGNTSTINSSNITGGAFTLAGGNSITLFQSNGTISISAGNYLTTAMASNANTSFVGLNTAQTNVTWTVNSSGISLNAGGYAGTVSGATNCNVTANTAGVSVSVAPGAGVTLSRFEYLPYFPATTASVISGASHQIQPFVIPFNLSASYIRFPVSNAFTSTTLGTIGTGATGAVVMYETHNLLIHSLGTGASSLSLRSYFSSIGASTFSTKWSISAASACTTLSVFYDATGATASNSTTVSTNLASLDFSSTFLSTLAGLRYMDIPCATSFSAGLWFLDYCKSSSSTTSGDGSLAGLAGLSNLIASKSFHMMTQVNNEYVINGQTSGNATDPLQWGLGIWSTNSTGATTASIPMTQISSTASNPVMFFQIMRVT